MNARRTSIAGAAALAVLVLVAACGTPAARQADPDLRSTGHEAGVAITVPGGAETLPTWERTSAGTATLVVPADLLFAKNSASLSPDAATVLAQVVTEFGPGRQVLVAGHADSDGEASHNLALSEHRATAVAGWLAGHGIPGDSLAIVGWGETVPRSRRWTRRPRPRTAGSS